MVYGALGWKLQEFGHMHLIINSETGKKLSKRIPILFKFIEDYRKKGYLPEFLTFYRSSWLKPWWGRRNLLAKN